MLFRKLKNPSSTSLIIFVAGLIACFANYTFFKKASEVYSFSSFGSGLFLFSLFIIIMNVIILLFNLVRSKYTTKFFLISALFLSSLTSYFIDTYNVVMDESMILNVLSTDLHEALDLFSFKLLLYFLLLGVFPSLLVLKTKLNYTSFKSEMISKLKNILASTSIILLTLFSFSKFYASFFREHKPLRYYTNPMYFIYSVGKYSGHNLKHKNLVIKPLGRDSKIVADDRGRELIIFVVGETARADRFSLNGYARETNPLLKKEEVISFSNMYSCGTSTATSVPCMFSQLNRENYSDEKAKSTENLLDVLSHTKKVNILWRDNNSNSHGVANRVTYEDFKNAPINTICDVECRDEGMLVGLQDYINKQKSGDIVIVLHQMGNHGPAYYKRYPANFEKFTPVCKTNQLEKCSNEEIGNVYDNAILYTDYFLAKVISLLKANSKDYETAMLYISDHGESLGENGVYLHGFPYFMAPEEQKKVAAVVWFGESMKEDIDIPLLKKKAHDKYSHDNIFHTMLGLMEVKTSVYDKGMDILNAALKVGNKDGKKSSIFSLR